MAQDRAKLLLQQGIAAAKAGQQDEARQTLQQAVRLDPQNESIWLWLSSVARDDKERVFCLKQILEINPNNELAQKGLKALGIEPAQTQQAATSVPTIAGDKLKQLQPDIDDFLRTYTPIPRTVMDVEWVRKQKRRYAEGRATRLRRTIIGSVAAIITLLLVGGVLLVLSLDIDLSLTAEATPRFTLTPSSTPTLTPTATPGVANTPTPIPNVTRTPIVVPENLPEGDPFQSTPTAIYPPLDPAVEFNVRQIAVAYSIGDYDSVKQLSADIRTEQSSNCFASTYYYEALALMNEGDFNAAENLIDEGFTREIQANFRSCAEDPLMSTALCQIKYEQAIAGFGTPDANLLDEAAALCQSSLGEDQFLQQASNTLAKIYITLGRLGQTNAFNVAANVLDDGLDNNPVNVDLFLTRADLFLAQGLPNQALVPIQSALKVDPANESALLKRIEAYLQIAQLTPGPEQIGRYGDVAISAEDFLLFYPGQPIGHVLLAIARFNEGNADRALQSLNRVLNVVETLPPEATPAITSAYALRAQIYLDRQNWEGALDDLQQLRKLEPQNSRWIELEVQADLQLGQYENALSTVLAGLALVPSQDLILAQARLLTQTCQYNSDIECDAEAVLANLTDEFIATLVGTRQGDALLYQSEALFAQLDGRDISDTIREQELEAILVKVNQAIVLHQTPDAYYLLGRLLEDLGQTAEALRAYEWVAYWTQFYQYPFGGRVERDIPRLQEELGIES